MSLGRVMTGAVQRNQCEQIACNLSDSRGFGYARLCAKNVPDYYRLCQYPQGWVHYSNGDVQCYQMLLNSDYLTNLVGMNYICFNSFFYTKKCFKVKYFTRAL